MSIRRGQAHLLALLIPVTAILTVMFSTIIYFDSQFSSGNLITGNVVLQGSECRETDSGMDPEKFGEALKGRTIGRDSCKVREGNRYLDVSRCDGPNCYLLETVCADETIEYGYIPCTSGCVIGACRPLGEVDLDVGLNLESVISSGSVCGNSVCEDEEMIFCPRDCPQGWDACIDSDGGNNIEQYGGATKISEIIYDSCLTLVDGEYRAANSCNGEECFIYEAVCNETKSINSVQGLGYETRRCLSECNAGSCGGEFNSCIDSDSGVELDAKGSVQKQGLSIEDTCLKKNLEDAYETVQSCSSEEECFIFEASCNDLGIVNDVQGIIQEKYRCLNGCSDGACLS